MTDTNFPTAAFAADDPTATRTRGDTVPAPAPAPAAGPANYELLGELGRGGMGVVYRARQAGFNRDVALKMVLSGGYASAAERARFLAEAEAVAAVQHPGVVQVYDFGSFAGQPYYAMEYCPGGSLGAAWAGVPLPGPAAAAVVEKVAAAVQAAHDRGVVHRDLKPANILLAADGTPKVTDFGLARMGDGGSGLTATGAVLGSPSYMSPEQAEGRTACIGTLSDVYSLGAILYEALSGRPPFRAATALDTMRQVSTADPVPPSRLAPGVPKDLETIALKCLEKAPARRYASAGAVAADLRRFLNGETILARPASPVERGVKWARRHRGATFTGLAAVAATVGFIVDQNAQKGRLAERTAAAETAETGARAAQVDADRSRAQAHARLDKAVEAVEKVMLRVAGERWALKPELQQERKEVLAEAVAFFQSFGDEDGQDPAVRRMTGLANLYAAAAHMSLADYPAGRAAADAAFALFRGLRDEFPGDSRYARSAIEATAMRGHFAAVGGRYADALQYYSDAVALAEELTARDPGRDENSVLLAEGNGNLALFYGLQQPDRAAAHHRRALEITAPLVDRPEPNFRAQLAYATAQINLAIPDRGGAAAGRLAAAGAQLQRLEARTAPSARAAEMFVLAKAAHGVFAGRAAVAAGRAAEGFAQMTAGLDRLRRLTAAVPKSFSLRIQLIQFLSVYADELIRGDRPADAEAVMREVAGHRDELLAISPQFVWVKNMGLMQRGALLIHRVRTAFPKDFDADAAELLALAAAAQAPAATYNVACAYAQAAAHAPSAAREGYAARAVGLLKELKAAGYFTPANAAHLRADTDLDPLRGRDDFRAFAASLTQ